MEVLLGGARKGFNNCQGPIEHVCGNKELFSSHVNGESSFHNTNSSLFVHTLIWPLSAFESRFSVRISCIMLTCFMCEMTNSLFKNDLLSDFIAKVMK